MRLHLLLGEPRVHQLLGRAVWASSLLFAGLAVIAMGRMLWLNSELGRLADDTKASELALSDTRRSFAASSAKPDGRTVNDGGVEAFQAALEHAAAQRGVIVVEVTVSPDRAPLVSPYGNLSAGGWTQASAKVTLLGDAPSVMDTFRAIQFAPVLFEVASLNLERQDVDSRGTATVSASADVRILRSPGGAS